MLSSTHRRLKHIAVLTLAMALALLAVGMVTVLHDRASANRDAAIRITKVTTLLNELLVTPYTANPALGGSPAVARAQLLATEARITTQMSRLQRDQPNASVSRVAAGLRADFVRLERIRKLAAANNMRAALAAGTTVEKNVVQATTTLRAASRDYSARASRSLTEATAGSAAVIFILLAGFGLFYRRSWVLLASNTALLDNSRSEALTDVLTGLGNRRAFMAHLMAVTRAAQGGGERAVLVLLDLNGFKHYNDTFGHPAGDALLTRLSARLATTVAGIGTAYRMGGDEFCVLATIDDGDGDGIARLAAAALSEGGDSFHISSSYGRSIVPDEASTPERALGLADQRMYAQKGSGRVSAKRQTTNVLLRVLGERDPDLEEHLDDVGRLAQRIAEQIGLPAEEVAQIRLAAELHDVGKTAIPESILNKPGKLDEAEWEFMRRQTLIGERILTAAPALAHTADLVRSSHERIDGTGYPDRLKGDAIPLGSRIIAICDAFDAMIAQRPYSDAVTKSEAMAELRRCAGTQFDPNLITALERLTDESDRDLIPGASSGGGRALRS